MSFKGDLDVKSLLTWCLLFCVLAVFSACDSKENNTPPTISPEQGQPTTLEQTALPAETAPPKTKAAGEAYFKAALDGDMQTLKSEVLAGVNVNAADSIGRTALMLAAFDGHTDLVEFLIAHGAAVNARDITDRTALMYAASGPNQATVKLLLEEDADVNAFDNHEKWTALMFAAAEGQTANVQMLLDSRADWSAKDVDGETARDFAQNNGHSEVVKILDTAARSKKD